MRRLALALALFAVAAPAARADWEVKRSPFDARVVTRYKQLLHANPDDGEALSRLTALYKQYKSVDALARELQSTADKSGDARDFVAVGNLLRNRGDYAGAAKAYAAALEHARDDARALAALADADVHLGKNAEALPLYQRALEQTSDPKKQRPLLKQLIDLTLMSDRGVDAKQAVAEARKWHEALVKLDPRDDEARREWAEALAAHGQPGEAAAEWRTLAEHLARDPARQGQAWLRAGELSEQANDDKAARAAYDKTFALAPKGNYLRREAADRIVGLARKHDSLRALAAEWDHAWAESGRDFSEWELLGRLHDELGDAEKAQADFKRALALDPHALDARRRLIALYERTGRDAEALAEYRRLIASAPGEPRFRLELAERLMKAGKSDEAIKIAQAVGRESSDPSLHGQLAELYTRWNLAELAMREQELLVRLEPDDEAHVVALGELWWQKGNKKRALEEWRKLIDPRFGRGPKVAAMARLAEVYVEHDMAPEALDLYQKAAKLAPDDVTVQKGLGATLERLHRDNEAEDVWTALFARAAKKHDRAGQLEARQRLLVVAQRTGRLGIIAGRYREDALLEKPKDEAVGAAYTLLAADALVKMGRMEMAEELLRGLADGSKDPSLRADAWMGLAQVARARHRLGDAVAALKKAAELAPERGHELYPQIAELSLQLYQDADALSYAKRAVQLGPADAAATVRLGEVLEKREDLDGAARAYERALEIDDRQWKVYFTLARLCIRQGQEARAAALYRTVMRRAPDEELVIDAARRAIDLEEYLGTLGELERELSPLAYAHADKPVYRNLLIELYDRYGTPLAARAQAPGNDDATVKPELQRLGEHGLRPLLDVLVDGEQHEQRVAVTLLGAIGNPSAAPALFKLALTRRPDDPSATRDERGRRIELREEAALAAAEVATARELPLLQKLGAEPEKELRVAAAYGLGRLADKRAQAALQRALDDGAVDVQAMACLSLGAHASGHVLDAMVAHLRANDARKPEARIGCALGLGAAALRADEPLSPGERATVRAALVATLGEGADEVQRAAAWALGAVGGDEARAPLTRAVFVKRDELRRVAALALAHRSALTARAAHGLPPPERGDDGLDVAATLATLMHLSATPSGDAPLPPPIDAIADVEAVAAALGDALTRHRDLIVRALDDLAAARDESEAALWPRVADKVRALATHADPAVRARVAKLAARNEDVELLAGALADKTRAVRLAALEAVAAAPAFSRPARAQVAALVERALRSPDWLERQKAALAAVPHPELWPDKGARVLAPLQKDPSGFVRQALR